VPPMALPPAPATASPSASSSARTEALPVLRETPPADAAATREDPVLADDWEVPTFGAESARQATESTEVFAPVAPGSVAQASEVSASEVTTRELPVVGAPVPQAPVVQAPVVQAPVVQAPAERDEPAPPTVRVPALSPEPTPGEAAPARSPQGIRYAGNGVPGMAGKQQADERDAAQDEDFWETEEAGQFAGLVYPAREDHPDPEADAGDADDSDGDAGDSDDDTGDADDDVGDLDDTGDSDGDTGDARKDPPELDDDAPPFATAPFASVPRLNRVRSTPTPPADEDE
jgi:hypothetical protein